MTIDDTALGRLGALIEKARAQAEDWSGYQGLSAQVATAVAAIAGPDSDYYKHVVHAERQSGSAQSGARKYAAILEALRDDVANGYLRRTADLIAAEVFGDFLDMAEHLIGAGYHHPAASLTGAVLEDGLRRLSVKAELKVKVGDDLSGLNNRLAAKEVYSNLVRKQIDAWTALRNLADHGQFDQVSPGDVRDMHAGVVRFLAEHIG